MKISELNDKTYLGAPGAAANSYVLINYEDNTTSEPVTYKATIAELGRSIANNLQLYRQISDGIAAVVTSPSQDQYVDVSGTNKYFVSSEDKYNINMIPSMKNKLNDLPHIVDQLIVDKVANAVHVPEETAYPVFVITKNNKKWLVANSGNESTPEYINIESFELPASTPSESESMPESVPSESE